MPSCVIIKLVQKAPKELYEEYRIMSTWKGCFFEMKRIKIEYLITAVSALVLVFLIGFFAGRNSFSPEDGTVIHLGSVSAESTEIPSVETTVSDAAADKAVSVEAADTTAADVTFPIDLNEATAEQIELLPGIGPELAARIIEYRDTFGAFKTIEEIQNVSGIGEKRFESIKSMITVEETP